MIRNRFQEMLIYAGRGESSAPPATLPDEHRVPSPRRVESKTQRSRTRVRRIPPRSPIRTIPLLVIPNK